MASRRPNWKKYGVEPLPGDRHGGARRFRDIQTGETMSRRQAENRRVIDEGGWDSWSQWQRTTSPTARETKETRRYQYFAESAAEGGDRRRYYKADSDFNKAYNEWRKSGYERGPRGDDDTPEGRKARRDKRNRPHGPYAKFLEASGRRTRGADYPVGGSPKRGKK